MHYNYQLIVWGRLPGLNEYTNANRNNRYAGARMKKDTEDKIKLHIREQMAGLKVKGLVAIGFTWHDTSRRDIDNICFAKKFILDALVSEGVIEGDDKKHVRHLVDVFPDKTIEDRVVVTIYPLEELTDEQKRLYKIE